MIFVVLCKYLNCAVDKTIGTGHTAGHTGQSAACNTNYRRIVLLLMLFITSWWKPLKTDPSREICAYVTWIKPSFADKLTCVCYFSK